VGRPRPAQPVRSTRASTQGLRKLSVGRSWRGRAANVLLAADVFLELPPSHPERVCDRGVGVFVAGIGIVRFAGNQVLPGDAELDPHP
jgi:hypothetical protein